MCTTKTKEIFFLSVMHRQTSQLTKQFMTRLALIGNTHIIHGHLWFHGKSTSITFMLLIFMIISLFIVKIEKVWLSKSLNEVFWDGGSNQLMSSYSGGHTSFLSHMISKNLGSKAGLGQPTHSSSTWLLWWSPYIHCNCYRFLSSWPASPVGSLLRHQPEQNRRWHKWMCGYAHDYCFFFSSEI
jgi:hypothetical protein